MLVFKSDSHRQMFQNMLKLQIKSSILNRFGGTGQEESRILRSKPFNEFLTLWSNSIINNLPKESKLQPDYIKSQIRLIPDDILSLPSAKSMMETDPSLKWLVGRINGTNDNVPKPNYPSVLRNRMIQFPFKHQDIQKSRDLYGLLKFPFYRLTTSLYADSSESFKGLDEPDHGNSQTTQQPITSKSNESDHTDQQPNYCSSNYIYAPSELETGLREI